MLCSYSFNCNTFQLTLPERGATAHLTIGVIEVTVSTHTPRAGSDGHTCFGASVIGCFNSHSPSGERQLTETNPEQPFGFNSRSPSGERQIRITANVYSHVSTHAPRVGSD